MSDTRLAAEERTDTGKGAARRLRAVGRMPAVLYGPGKPGRSLAVDAHALERLLRTSRSGINTLIDLHVGGEKTVVLVKELQRDPVRGSFLHADLYEVDLRKTVEVEVPLHFVGKSKGVENGGILDHPLRELQIECLPRAIPEFIEVDVSALDVGDSIHVREVKLPEGSTLVTDPELTVASVVAPRIEEEPTEGVALEGEAAAEAAAAPSAEAEGESA